METAVTLTALVAWLQGWRRDEDGWYVRARRWYHPDLSDFPDIGFTEEASISVRSARQAVAIERLARHANIRAGVLP